MTAPRELACIVVSARDAPDHLPRLHEWLAAEWGAIDSLGDESRPASVPPALLATDGPDLLGGLVFTRFLAPRSDSQGLWINAVFVAPEHRHRRIASRLIRAAEAEAVRIGERELFALTDVPDLYRKLGWETVERGPDGTILQAALSGRGRGRALKPLSGV